MSISAAVQCLLLRPWLALVLALIIESAALIAGRGDFVASDPLWYANIAHQLSISPAEVFASHDTHPFVMRLGLTVPLAILYRAFGVSTLVSNLPCLLGALGILVVVYAAAPTPRAKLLGMLFGAASIPLVRNASILNVDLPSAALMGCAILCLARRHRPRGAGWLVAAVVAWFAAFLVKESALWCSVVWLYAVVCDLRGAGMRAVARRYAPALVVGLALAAGYLVLCAKLWGDPLARFHGIQELTYEHAWTLHGKGAGAWLKRLTWEPPLLLAKMFEATLVPVVLAPWLVRGSDRIWWFATAAFAALYWVGSTSLSSYSPLPISQRMVLPVLPVILVLAALASDRALDRLAGSRWRTVIAAAMVVAIVVPGGFALLGVASRPRPETAAFAVVRDEAADPARQVVVVCGEPRCVEISSFYFEFAPPANVTVTFARDFAAAPRPDHATVRALVNVGRSSGARRTDPHLDMTQPIEALALRPIVWHPNVRLYDAGDGARLWEALRAVH